MSIKMWSYEPEKCDGDYCPGRCDNCNKAYDGEHIPFWTLFKAVTRQSKEELQKEIENE